MENKYKIMKERHQKEVNELPYMFAFDNEQFKRGLEKLGLNENEMDKLIYLGDNIYLKRTDLPKVEEVNKRHKEEIEREIKADTAGDKFIKDMFLYEMNNHEYGYTNEIEPILDVLHITDYDLRKNENIRNGLLLAKQYYIDKDKELEEIEEEIEK